MNFVIQNLQLRKDPKIIEETFFGIEFSFDINLDDNIIGHCNVLMKNSIQHMKITDHVGNIFTFKPRKQSFVEIEDMGKNFSKLSQCHIEKNSQKSSLDNKDDVLTQHDLNRAANNLTNEDMLVEDNDLEVFSPVTENDNSLPNNNDVSPETVDSSSGKNSQKSLTEINFNGEEQKLNNTEGNLETHYRKMGYIQDKEPRNLTSENEVNICNSTEITTSQNNQNFTKEQQSATESESIDRSRGNNFQSVGNNISREKSPTEIKIEDFFDEQRKNNIQLMLLIQHHPKILVEMIWIYCHPSVNKK
ncbi:myb-like protein D [Clytia hemisphaerica]|uniref:myb-like protein D n=1 Tax=Clytia hemisphaerica TaxID=252671 RepID=UPI0034D79D41